MDVSLILSIVLTVPILFFFVGLTVVFVKLAPGISHSILTLLLLCLLVGLGLQNTHQLFTIEVTSEIVLPLIAAVITTAMSVYFVFTLWLKLNDSDAIAFVAAYDLMSVVTFVTADWFSDTLNGEFGGSRFVMLLLMAPMTIIFGLSLGPMVATSYPVPILPASISALPKPIFLWY